MNHRLGYVFDMFENILRQKYNGEDIRDTQVKMGIAVAGLISSNDKILMCNAPVGTGKTFAALVPGIYDTYKEGLRLIYSTSSLNLQAQLKNEELKFLKEHGDIKDFIVAKGMTNYICVNKIESSDLADIIKSDLIKFSLQETEGDRVDFEESFYSLTDDIWAMVRLETLKDCLVCGRKTICPTANHRSRFNDLSINVVVTNHNQLVQSVLNVQEGRPPIINFNIPGGVLVIDEAHDFEDAVLSQLAERILLMDLRRIINKLSFENGRSARKSLGDIIQYIKTIKSKMDTTRGRYRLSDECIQALSQIKNDINKEITARTAQQIEYRGFYRENGRETELDNATELIGKLLDFHNYSNWVTFEDEKIEITVVNKKFRINARSIVAEMMRNNKIVFMSGTLAVDNSFDNIYYSWNGKFQRGTEELILNTVFDYKKQAMVYIPKNMPSPVPTFSENFLSYTKTLAVEIIELIKITGGRTLILCTSYKQMDQIAQTIQPVLKELGIALLKQKDKSIELLSKDFKKDETSVLIGTGSFFAGLSIPGKSLISVILCRLPFPTGDDPFMELLGQDLSLPEKMEYLYVPRMIIKLLQAAGRLIRTKYDFGCFTVLDPRIFTEHERYGEKVLSELNTIGYPLTRNREEIKAFIERNMSEPVNIKYPVYDRDSLIIPKSLLSADSPRIIKKETVIENSLADFEKTITQPQITYYQMVRKRANLTRVLSEKTPYDLFAHLMILVSNRGLDFNVTDEFPFLTPNQKETFIRRFKVEHNDLPINRQTTRLSREEIDERYKQLKIKKHTRYRDWDK